MKYCLLVFVCFVLSLDKSFAQSLKDSTRVRQYNAKSKAFLENRQFDSAQSLAEKGADLAQKIRFRRGELESMLTLHSIADLSKKVTQGLPYLIRAKALAEQLREQKPLSIIYSNIGYIHLQKGNYELAKANYLLALKVREAMNDRAGVGGIYNSIGNIHNSKSEYSEALEYYNKSLAIKREFDDKNGISIICNNLGNLYYSLNDFKKAEAAYEESIKLKRELKDFTGLGGALVNMASVQRRLGNSDKMISFLLEALNLLEDSKNDKYLTSLLNNIAVYYAEQNSFELSQYYYIRALHLRLKQEDVRGKVVTYLGISNLYIKRNMPDSATHFVNLAIEQTKISGLRKEERDAYRLMADVQYIKGDYKAALESYRRYSGIKDTLLDDERVKQLAFAQTQFESSQKERENELLRKENMLIEAEVARKRLQQEQMLLQADQERQKYIVLSAENKAKEVELENSELAKEAKVLENILLKQKQNAQTIEIEKSKKLVETQKQLTLAFVGFLGLTLGILFVIWRSRNNQKKANLALQQKNTEITQKTEEITRQKEEISLKTVLLQEKNENLTASINYAKRIQAAILPTFEVLTPFLADFTIFWKPRDIVSGDFYWFGEVREAGALPNQKNLLIAIIDCTGHGVPGAFMSMIANDLLNVIITEKLITEPAQILDGLDKEIRKVLRQDETHNQDGMDIGLVKVCPHEHKLVYAGAKISLLYDFDVSNNTAFEVLEANRSSIGGIKMPSDKDGYRQTELAYSDKSLVFYLATDGYPDQFGGPDQGKFKTKAFRQMLFKNRHLAMPKQHQIWDSTLVEWMQTSPKQTDDISVFGARISC